MSLPSHSSSRSAELLPPGVEAWLEPQRFLWWVRVGAEDTDSEVRVPVSDEAMKWARNPMQPIADAAVQAARVFARVAHEVQ